MTLNSLSSDHDSRLEDWFTRQYRKLVLDGHVSKASDNCPDDLFLRAIASTKKPSLRDPRVGHVGHCQHCLARVLALRDAAATEPASRGKSVSRLAIAASAGCLLTVAFVTTYLSRYRQTSPTVAVEQTLDLSSFGVLRGETRRLDSVKLSPSLDRVTIILPRLSEIGPYTIAISRDQSGQQPIASGKADAIQQGTQQIVKVLLDLHGARRGAYYLSTTFETDTASNYYPVVVDW